MFLNKLFTILFLVTFSLKAPPKSSIVTKNIGSVQVSIKRENIPYVEIKAGKTHDSKPTLFIRAIGLDNEIEVLVSTLTGEDPIKIILSNHYYAYIYRLGRSIEIARVAPEVLNSICTLSHA